MTDQERARAFLERFPLDPFNVVQGSEDQTALVALIEAIRLDERRAIVADLRELTETFSVQAVRLALGIAARRIERGEYEAGS